MPHCIFTKITHKYNFMINLINDFRSIFSMPSNSPDEIFAITPRNDFIENYQVIRERDLQNRNTIKFQSNNHTNEGIHNVRITINHPEETAIFIAFGSTFEEINDKMFTYFKWLNERFTLLNTKNGLRYTLSDFQRLKKIQKLDKIHRIFCIKKELSELPFFNRPDTEDPEYNNNPNFDRAITFKYKGKQVTFPVSLNPNNGNNFDNVKNFENKIYERSLYKTERFYLNHLENGYEFFILSNEDLREAIDDRKEILISPIPSISTCKQIIHNIVLLVVAISIGIFAKLVFFIIVMNAAVPTEK